MAGKSNKYVQQIHRMTTELARQYLWQVSLSTTPPNSTLSLEQVTLRALTNGLPAHTIESYPLPHKGSNTYWAGRDTSEKTIEMTFYDAQDLGIYLMFFNWMDYCKINNKFDGGEYTRDWTMTLLGRGTEEKDTPIATIKLIKAWPQSTAQVSLDYAVNEPLMIAVTVQFDDIIAKTGEA